MSERSVLPLAAMYATLMFLLVKPTAAQGVDADPGLTSLLRLHDETLLKAVHTADRATWRSLAAPDFLYIDEEGGVTSLDAFLQELKPDSSTPLEIRSYRVTRAGDTVIVLQEDRDDNNVQYVVTETWQSLNGAWKLRVLHITNVLSDPPAIQLSAAQIDELTGTYHRGVVTFTVRREAERILVKRGSDSETEEKAETRDVLFSPGNPRVRRIFVRDAAGHVVGFIRRYESSETYYEKIG